MYNMSESDMAEHVRKMGADAVAKQLYAAYEALKPLMMPEDGGDGSCAPDKPKAQISLSVGARRAADAMKKDDNGAF